jgi:hypothetical protein
MATYAGRPSAEAIPGADAMPATTAWPVSWSAVFVGALSALAFAFLAGLIGVTIGASQLSQGEATRPFGFWSMAYTVAAAFFAFAVGGWVAGKMSGDRRSETTSLHGAIAWLLCLPTLIMFLALGGGPYLGTWYGGLAGLSGRAGLAAAPDVRPTAEPAGSARAGATTVTAPTARARAEARDSRNAALGGLTALVLGLAGSVLGGWMASGEPMSLRYRRPVAARVPSLNS